MSRSIIAIPVLIAFTGCDTKLPLSIHVTTELEIEEGDPASADPSGDDTGDPGDPGDPAMVSVEDRQEFSVDLEVSSVDVTFLLDTTGSMTTTIGGLGEGFDDLANSIEDRIVDPAYGYATFDDYNFGIMGSGDDRPFILRQRVTTARERIQESINSTSIHSGADGPESTMEALYQSLTGAGYDQNGDGIFDASTDVIPGIGTPSDPFGGLAGSLLDPTTVGGGEIGGMGFRDGSLPVIVYITDNHLRDPDNGYATPGGAPFDAGSINVAKAAEDTGARLIGVMTSAWTGSEAAVTQMVDLAEETRSLYEADFDGLVDDPLVFTSDTRMGGNLGPDIDDALRLMMDGLTFDQITAEIVGESHGFLIELSLEEVSDVRVGPSGRSVEVIVSVAGEVAASGEEQVFPLKLEIYGDNTTLIGTHSFDVVVPPAL